MIRIIRFTGAVMAATAALLALGCLQGVNYENWDNGRFGIDYDYRSDSSAVRCDHGYSEVFTQVAFAEDDDNGYDDYNPGMPTGSSDLIFNYNAVLPYDLGYQWYSTDGIFHNWVLSDTANQRQDIFGFIQGLAGGTPAEGLANTLAPLSATLDVVQTDYIVGTYRLLYYEFENNYTILADLRMLLLTMRESVMAISTYADGIRGNIYDIKNSLPTYFGGIEDYLYDMRVYESSLPNIGTAASQISNNTVSISDNLITVMGYAYNIQNTLTTLSNTLSSRVSTSNFMTKMNDISTQSINNTNRIVDALDDLTVSFPSAALTIAPVSFSLQGLDDLVDTLNSDLSLNVNIPDVEVNIPATLNINFQPLYDYLDDRDFGTTVDGNDVNVVVDNTAVVNAINTMSNRVYNQLRSLFVYREMFGILIVGLPENGWYPVYYYGFALDDEQVDSSPVLTAFKDGVLVYRSDVTTYDDMYLIGTNTTGMVSFMSWLDDKNIDEYTTIVLGNRLDSTIVYSNYTSFRLAMMLNSMNNALQNMSSPNVTVDNSAVVKALGDVEDAVESVGRAVAALAVSNVAQSLIGTINWVAIGQSSELIEDTVESVFPFGMVLAVAAMLGSMNGQAAAPSADISLPTGLNGSTTTLHVDLLQFSDLRVISNFASVLLLCLMLAFATKKMIFDMR